MILNLDLIPTKYPRKNRVVECLSTKADHLACLSFNQLTNFEEHAPFLKRFVEKEFINLESITEKYTPHQRYIDGTNTSSKN